MDSAPRPRISLVRISPFGISPFLAACILLLAGGAASADVDFVETGPYPLPSNAGVILAADVNADGHLDLVTAHFGSPILRFSLGDGTGAFVLQAAGLDIGFNAGSLASADVDGDSLIDLAATSLGTPAVGIFRNLGGGVFTPHQTLDPGALPGACLFGDFTGDGLPDLAVAKGASVALDPPALRLYVNTAGILGTGPADIPVAHNPIHLVAAHFDAGTTLDLAVASAGEFFGPDGGLAVLLGSGTGSFTVAPAFGSLHPSQLSAADLDGDGDTDLATIVATFASGCGFDGQIYSNSGAAAFVDGQGFDFGCGPFVVLAANFDDDPQVELLFTDGGDLIPAQNNFQIAERDGGGTWSLNARSWNGLFTLAPPALGDFDEDGRLDVAFAGYQGGLYVFENTTAPPPAQDFLRGDTNEDSGVNIADAVNLLAVLFTPGTPPLACPDAGDGNDDGAVNIADAISILSGLFAGGPPPPPPFPDCGPDGAPDALGACAYPC